MGTKLIQNEDENRFEIYYGDKMMGFTQGNNHVDHVLGARLLIAIAEYEGRTVELVGVDLDAEQPVKIETLISPRYSFDE